MASLSRPINARLPGLEPVAEIAEALKSRVFSHDILVERLTVDRTSSPRGSGWLNSALHETPRHAFELIAKI